MSNAPRPGRVKFTSDEDQLLVKYIAKYNPGVAGRSGNALYQRLVQDVDGTWPWARRHTWHSWRDRYCHRKDWFNHRILKYQERRGLPTENPDIRIVRLSEGTSAYSKHEVSTQKEDREREKPRRSGVQETRTAGPPRTGTRILQAEGNSAGEPTRNRTQEGTARGRSPPLGRSRYGIDAPPQRSQDSSRTLVQGSQFSYAIRNVPVSQAEDTRRSMRAQSFDVPPSDDYGGEIFDGPSNDEDEDAGEIPKRHQEEGVTPTQHAPVRDRDKVRATSAHIWSQEPRSSATERTLLDVTFSASQLAQSTPRGPLSQSDDTSLLDSFVQTQEPTPPPSGLDGDAAVDVEAETSGLDDTDLHPVKSGTHVIPTTKAHKYRETRVVAGENIHTENGSGAHAQRELSVAPTAETDAFTDFSRSPTVTTQLRQPELSLTTPSRPSFSQKRAPREAPYFEEGPYINALTDARRRSRFSSGKRRASGVDDEDYERATEHSKTVAEGHVSEWPPRRKKRKVKAASSERETTPTGVDGRSHVAAPPSSHSAKGKERILGEPEQERLRAQIIGTQPVSNIRNLSTPHAEISSSEKPVFGERDAEEALASTESVDLDDIMDDGGSSADEVLDVLGDPEEDEETDQEPLQESELDEALLSTTHNAGPFGKPGLAPTPSYTERALQRYTEAHRLEAAAVSSAERASERGGFPKRRSTVSSGYLGAAREPPLGLAPSHAPLPGRLQFDGHPASDPPRGRRLSRHLREQAGDDPFLDESQGSPDLDVSGRRQARHRRRQTFGGFSAAEQIPYIDLLAALAREKVTYRRSSVRSSPARRTSGWLHAPLSSAHSSFASGRSSPASRSSVDDLTYMQRVGYETVMARIAETHGFHVNVVKRVHARTNDLGKTEQVIQRLKEFAEESVDKAFEDVEHYGSEPRSFVNMSFQRSHRSSSASRPPARRVSRRSDSPLKNSFLASREPSADDMSVGYTPPQATRAGDFLELSRQGRWKEALRREQRRASVVPPLPLRLSDGPSPNTTDTANRARSMEKTHPHSARRSEGWTTRRTWGATEDRLLASDDPEVTRRLSEQFGESVVRRKVTAFFTGST